MTSFSEALAQAGSNADDRPLDWSIIHPDHRERLQSVIGANATQTWIEGMAVTFPADGFIVARGGVGGRDVIDLSDLEHYLARCAETAEALDARRSELADARASHSHAKLDADAARLARDTAVRDYYRRGATAAELAGATGLSLPRIHQLVAGVRK